MNTHLSNPRFDYSQLSAEEKGKIQYFEGILLNSRKRLVTELMDFGEVLHQVQQTLANHKAGVFTSWIASMGLSKGTAYNAISAYLTFGSCPNLDNLEVSAMYELAKNSAAKDKALKLAGKGLKVTRAVALNLIEETKKPPSTPKPEPKDEAPAPPPPPPPPTEAADPFDEFPETEEDPFEAPEGSVTHSEELGPDEPVDAPTPARRGNGTPPKQYDRSYWYKQWDRSIGPTVRLINQIADNLGEKHCKSHKAVRKHLHEATAEIAKWLEVDK